MINRAADDGVTVRQMDSPPSPTQLLEGYHRARRTRLHSAPAKALAS